MDSSVVQHAVRRLLEDLPNTPELVPTQMKTQNDTV